MKKKVNISKIMVNFFYALGVLMLGGFFLDLIFQTIPEEGVFKEAINLLKLVAPGVSDVTKIFLDVFYAIIYGISRK